MTAEKGEPARGPEQSERLRPVFPWAPGDDIWGGGERDTKTLDVVLEHATTCLGGLGAMVHRHDGAAGRLRLVAAGGLARERAAVWADLLDQQDVAPALAVRRRAFVSVAGDSLGVGASGTAAVPFPAPTGRPVCCPCSRQNPVSPTKPNGPCCARWPGGPVRAWAVGPGPRPPPARRQAPGDHDQYAWGS